MSHHQSNPRRRVRHDIVVGILEIAKKGVRKTTIMNKVGLSYFQLKKYLNALEKAEFLAEESSKWKTTKKGLQVIEACKICHSFIKEIS